jgi:hypothetical protein
MSSTSPDVPVETGSRSDYKVWDVNSMAEPIMRIWQLSEALSRMAKRVQKRYPDEARILRSTSEDIIHYFFEDMKEQQENFFKALKTAESDSAKEQDRRQRGARASKKARPEANNEIQVAPTTILTPVVQDLEDSSSIVESIDQEVGEGERRQPPTNE